jgi:hypothetical protein
MSSQNIGDDAHFRFELNDLCVVGSDNSCQEEAANKWRGGKNKLSEPLSDRTF